MGTEEGYGFQIVLEETNQSAQNRTNNFGGVEQRKNGADDVAGGLDSVKLVAQFTRHLVKRSGELVEFTPAGHAYPMTKIPQGDSSSSFLQNLDGQQALSNVINGEQHGQTDTGDDR